MPSTYSTNLRFELMATGEKSGTWGTISNTNIGTLIEQAISGVASVTHDNSASYSLTTGNGTTDEARNAVVNVTGTLSAARNLVVPSVDKLYVIKNSTSGGFNITVKTSAGTGVVVENGNTKVVFCDATNVEEAITEVDLNKLTTNFLEVDNLQLDGNTISSTNTNGNVLIQPNGTGDTIINESGADSDFRVEGATNANMILVDASADSVGVGTAPDSSVILHVKDSAAGTMTKFESTEAGSAHGPTIEILRNSSSPADSDEIGRINFNGKDSAGNTTGYAQIETSINDVTNGTEDGTLAINTVYTGSLEPRLTLNPNEAVFNENSLNNDFRIESNGNTHAMFLDAGTSVIGFNISTPRQILHVNQPTASSDAIIRITNTNTPSTGNHRVEFGDGTGTTEGSTVFRYGFVGGERSGGSNNGHLSFGTKTDNSSSPNEKMRLTSSGNVGILGSTSTFDTTPEVNGLQLYYESDSGLATIASYSNGGGTQLDFQTNTGGGATDLIMTINTAGVIVNPDAEDKDFRVATDNNNHTLFVQGSNDKVGIVDSTPVDTLTIGSGNMRFKGTGSRIMLFNSNSAYSLGSSGGTAINLFEASSGHQGMAFEVHDTGVHHREAMRIQPEGNVCVGPLASSGVSNSEHEIEARGTGNIFIATSGGSFGTDRQGFVLRRNGTFGSMIETTAGYSIDSYSFNGSDQFRWIKWDGSSVTPLMRLNMSGQLIIKSTYVSNGSPDYAEYFEWADGNTSNENRKGETVVLVDGKVRIATSSDAPADIIGVVSRTAGVILDSGEEEWTQRYLTDDYGEIQTHSEQFVTYTSESEGGKRERPVGTEALPSDAQNVEYYNEDVKTENPDYDPDREYTPRRERQEWDPIGLMGKLRVTKGRPVNPNWIKMRDISATVEEWLVR